MTKNKLLALFIAIFLSFQAVFATDIVNENQPQKEVVTKRKIFNDKDIKQTETTTQPITKATTKKQQTHILPSDKWNTLTTTNIPGVYRQKTDSLGRQTNRYFFYNQVTKKMVEIPNKKTISSIKDLGSLENDYKIYSNKSNTFTHNGKTYIIPSAIYNETIILANDSWKYLITTKIPGIYQMRCFCGKCGPTTEYFFYNTKTKQMIYIYTSEPISSTKDLGEKEKEFKLYGNKTNTFTHQGVKYTIPKE